jgi:hypothetical protein
VVQGGSVAKFADVGIGTALQQTSRRLQRANLDGLVQGRLSGSQIRQPGAMLEEHIDDIGTIEAGGCMQWRQCGRPVDVRRLAPRPVDAFRIERHDSVTNGLALVVMDFYLHWLIRFGRRPWGLCHEAQVHEFQRRWSVLTAADSDRQGSDGLTVGVGAQVTLQGVHLAVDDEIVGINGRPVAVSWSAAVIQSQGEVLLLRIKPRGAVGEAQERIGMPVEGCRKAVGPGVTTTRLTHGKPRSTTEIIDGSRPGP